MKTAEEKKIRDRAYAAKYKRNIKESGKKRLEIQIPKSMESSEIRPILEETAQKIYDGKKNEQAH